MSERRTIRIEHSPLEIVRLIVEMLAFLAAGAWALYTFVYQTKIEPAFVPPHENVSVNVDRLAVAPGRYIERVRVSIENDGTADVDTAALALSLYGLKSSSRVNVKPHTASGEEYFRDLPASAWQPLMSHGVLFDGAISGSRARHAILRPGDKASIEELAFVPLDYRVLKVTVQSIYARYPIERRLDVKLQQKAGAVSLRSDALSMSLAFYFGV